MSSRPLRLISTVRVIISTRSSWSPRLLAIDVDGTLTRPSRGVDNTLVPLLSELGERGVAVVVATGRGQFAAAEITKHLSPTAYAVLNNGGVIRCLGDGRIVRARHLSYGAATSVLEVYRREGMVGIWVESPFAGSRYLCDGAWWDHLPTKRYLSTKAPIVRPLPAPTVAGCPVEVFAFGDRTAVGRAERAIQCTIGSNVSTVSWWSDRLEAGGLEALPPGVTKGEAVAWLANELGIDASESVAVGDDRNDLEMLQWAGHSVAMAHAPADVRAAATQVSEVEGPPAVRQLLGDIWGV